MDKPNVFFLILDSLRSDYVFKTTKSVKPNLEFLEHEGVSFPNTISSADGTILSWSSIFTGKFPFKTGIRSCKFNRLSSDTITFFDILEKEKYHFYSYLPKLSKTVGLFPKFENNDNLYDFYMGLTNGLGEKILKQLHSGLTEPWFFLIHSMDLHPPITIDKEFENNKYGENYYERKISEIDPWLLKISKSIDFSNTLFIITADHGSYVKSITRDGKEITTNFNTLHEKTISKISKKTPKKLISLKNNLFFIREKMENQKKQKMLKNIELKAHETRALMSGRADLDHFLFDEKIKVPLLIIGKNIPKGKKFSQQIRTIDIFPTILDLLKIKINEDIDGSSLLNLMNDIYEDEKIAYMESNPLVLTDSNDVIGLRTSKYKYFRDKNNPKNRIHLYDLENDPFEDFNIASSNISKTNNFENILSNILKDFKTSSSKNDDELSSEEIENELRKLGYV